MNAVLKTIRHIAQEFSGMSDDDLNFWVELSEPYVGKKQFGKLYTQALAYLTAHKMKMAGLGDSSKGTIAESIRVASVSEGDVSVSYASPVSSTISADSELQLTEYGIQFISIRKRVIVPILISSEV